MGGIGMKRFRLLFRDSLLAVSLALAHGSLTSEGAEPKERPGPSPQWCFAWLVTPPQGVGERAALVKEAMWAPGTVITVSFLDGDAAVQKKVVKYAKKWTRESGGPANLTFDFRKPPRTDIRISFKYEGSWSTIGKSCRHVPKDQPTMNFGWLTPKTPDVEYQRVVLHEFGHAIGLIHEHQNPAGGIVWNQIEVIKDLSGPPNNWSIPVISQNMFRPYEANETNFSQIDPNSIMIYPIPKRWTKNGFSANLNDDLSPLDKAFIRNQYP
jgi:serralysin